MILNYFLHLRFLSLEIWLCSVSVSIHTFKLSNNSSPSSSDMSSSSSLHRYWDICLEVWWWWVLLILSIDMLLITCCTLGSWCREFPFRSACKSVDRVSSFRGDRGGSLGLDTHTVSMSHRCSKCWNIQTSRTCELHAFPFRACSDANDLRFRCNMVVSSVAVTSKIRN